MDSITNLELYKKDLEKLIAFGVQLLNALQYESYPLEFKKNLKKEFEEKTEEELNEFINNLPSFKYSYQEWYSEALSLIQIIIPNRLSDFIRLFQPSKNRKRIDYKNYVIEDCLDGIVVNSYGNKFGSEAAIPKFRQQVSILKSARRKFESSLFNIEQLLQVDLFDNEIECATELNKKGFIRGGGAIAGVVLEKHLKNVCKNHDILIKKKTPTINDFNQLLKDNDVLDIADWRFIQRLGDLRNKCDHFVRKDPTKDEVEELINGVDKIIKKIF